MSLVITGATIIDAVESKPIEGRSIWVENGRIKAIERPQDIGAAPGTRVIQARGQYVIPGLMNANVHLLMDIRPEILARHMDHFEDLIVESAQIALKSGLTTVFDTWGPRKHLVAVRDKINSGKVPGSRIFCAGNIVGLDGPFSPDFDFFSKGSGAVSPAFARKVNATWVENVGRHLMWLTPDGVGKELRAYVKKGIDFVKYASNDHVPGAFLAFSLEAQRQIVEAAHGAGITAQAHTMSVEGLRIAVEAGCNLIQHANITGPTPIPEKTLESMIARKVGAVVFPQTERRLEQLKKSEAHAPYRGPVEWQVSDQNVHTLIGSGVSILFANDGAIVATDALNDPIIASGWADQPEGNLFDLSTGHFYWLRAMEEKGFAPMEMLKAATINVAAAYGLDRDLGSLKPGKVADMLILDQNPLEKTQNYRGINTIIKEGKVVNRESLPLKRILTEPAKPADDDGSYVTYISSGTYPMCPMCRPR